MLVLCSDGLSSEKILSTIKSKMRDSKTAALVVTADPEYKENNYHVDRCICELNSLGLIVDVFDLDEEDFDFWVMRAVPTMLDGTRELF